MKQEQKTLRLKSVPESIHQVERLIEEVCNDNNLNHNYLGCISVVLTEVFDNALEHGNMNDPNKFIQIDFEKTSTGLKFCVADEGNGFDYKKIPDIKEDGKEKIFPGKGILLIKLLADEVTYIEPGNRVELGFKTSAINFETSVDRLKKFQDYSVPAKHVAK